MTCAINGWIMCKCKTNNAAVNRDVIEYNENNEIKWLRMSLLPN